MLIIISRYFPVPHRKYKPLQLDYACIKTLTFTELKHKSRLTEKSAIFGEQSTDSLIYRNHVEKTQC